MFDVAWTEPVETVGQRKTRKDKKAKRFSQNSSAIRSNSSGSASPSQTRPSLFEIFSQQNGTLQRSGSSSRLGTIRSESTIKPSKRISSDTVTSDSSNHGLPDAKIDTRIQPQSYSDDGRQSNFDTEISSPSDDSVFSRWNTRLSTGTESSWASNLTRRKGEMLQPLSRNSYVTQDTEVTVSPRDSVNEDEQIATVVRISSVGTLPIEINSSQPHPTATTFDFPIPALNITQSPVPSRRAASHKTNLVLRSKDPPAETWRPPKAWQCPSAKVGQPTAQPLKSLRQLKARKGAPCPSEFTILQNSIRKMNAASPKIILERLKEEWVGVVDASIYRELELEKQLWMLAAVRALETDDASLIIGETGLEDSALTSKKILSLYENKASSSFLSASNPDLEIHHISTSPLLPKHYPNVRPLVIPGPSAHLPYASNVFALIHAISLPALLPASSIPALLKECHRTLTSPHKPTSPAVSPTTLVFPSTRKAGSLHLTILDPSPISSTVGCLLRAWLDIHLIVNLERQFRCINPARLFPIWLADAGLRAEGSTICNVRFLAAASYCRGSLSLNDDADQDQDKDNGESVKQELKSIVGRLVWKEMWGPFVEGDKRWWEDEKIMEECEIMGTCWEYAIIKAVREV